MSKEIEKKQDELRRLNEQVEYISLSLNPLRLEKDALVAELEQYKKQIEDIQNQIPNAEEKLYSIHTQIKLEEEKLNKSIDSFKEEFGKKQAEMVLDLSTEYNRQKEEIEKLFEKRKELDLIVKRLSIDESASNLALIDITKQISTLQDEKKSVQDEVSYKTSELNKEFSSMTDKISALKEQYKAEETKRNEELTKLNFEVENLTKTIARLRSEKEEISNFDPTIKDRTLAEVDELEKTKVFLKNQIKELQSENDSLTQERVNLSKIKETLQNAQLYIKNSYEKAGLHYTDITI